MDTELSRVGVGGFSSPERGCLYLHGLGTVIMAAVGLFCGQSLLAGGPKGGAWPLTVSALRGLHFVWGWTS